LTDQPATGKLAGGMVGGAQPQAGGGGGDPPGSLWGRVKSALPIVAIAISVVALVVVLTQGEGSSSPSGRLPPAEFLYVDGPRILNYLAQLEGGRVEEVHQISKEIRSLSGGAAAGGLEAAASTQRESVADSTVTRTQSSVLALLLKDLAADDRHGASVRPVRLDSAKDLGGIEEGQLVRFVTHSLLSPGYIRPYVVIRQSATFGALFPQFRKHPAGVRRATHQRRKAEVFARQVGPNPRITFAVSPPPSDGETPLKVLLPMHYLGLTSERSLLAKGDDRYVGGRLVVIGKVARMFPPDEEGEEEEAPAYTDFATQEIWRSPLEHAASNYLVDEVSHNCETRHSNAELVKAERNLNAGVAPERSRGILDRPIEGRQCLLAKLKRQTRLYAPGAVILPLAVYK
jgi:hypothetical protein